MNDCPFKVCQFTIWLFAVAFIFVVGIEVLNELLPVHALLLLWIADKVVNDWPFKVCQLTNWLFVLAFTEHKGITENVAVSENVVFPRIVFTPTLEPITIAPPAIKLLYIEFVVVVKLANKFLE